MSSASGSGADTHTHELPVLCAMQRVRYVPGALAHSVRVPLLERGGRGRGRWRSDAGERVHVRGRGREERKERMTTHHRSRSSLPGPVLILWGKPSCAPQARTGGAQRRRGRRRRSPRGNAPHKSQKRFAPFAEVSLCRAHTVACDVCVGLSACYGGARIY